MENLKKQPLWFWGVLFFMGGAGANIFGPPPHNQAEALGAGCATLLFFIVGLVLVIMHFVRRAAQRT